MKAKDYIIISVIFAAIAAAASAITAWLIVKPALSSMAAAQEEIRKASASANGDLLSELRKISEGSAAAGTELKEIKGHLDGDKAGAEGSHTCLVFAADAVSSCKPGQKVVFMPLRWGNDQLPIFVSQYCDLNYTVVWNNGGVTCIRAQYTDAELEQMERERKEAEEQGKAEGQGDGAKEGEAKQDQGKEQKGK